MKGTANEKKTAAAHEINDEDEIQRINVRLEEIVTSVSEECAAENKEMMERALSLSSDSLEGLSQSRMWNIKKKLIPKNVQEAPSAIKDSN